MCALSALVMIEVNCAIDESMLVIGMELKTRNCCSVCSMNDGQFALLQFVCVTQCGVGGKRERVVIMIRRWSEGSVRTVRHVLFCSSVGEKRLYLRRMCGSVPGVGCECIVLCCLGWSMLLNCVLMCLPLVLF